MIQLNHVSCIKNNHMILNDIHLHIQSGEKIAIVGPSGAGKTTLFNILTKVETSYSGDVLISNQNITQYQDNKVFADWVGTIAQGNHLIHNLKVKHNVAIGLFKEWSFFESLASLFSLREKSKITHVLEQVQMHKHMHKKAADLSGGEKQRVAIARLLLQNPKIVLADEPIAALDPKLARQAIELLLHHTQDKTLLMILHHVNFATDYFDRIIGLKNGAVYFDKKASEVNTELLGELYE